MLSGLVSSDPADKFGAADGSRQGVANELLRLE